MTKIIDLSKKSAPTEKRIDREKKRMGAMIRRLRLESVTIDGKKPSLRKVAERVGLNPSMLSAAESGNMSLNTYLILMGFYRNHTSFGFTLLSEFQEDNLIPIKTLRKFANDEALTASEFIRAVTLFPEQEFHVTRRAVSELSSLGYATRCDINASEPRDYACTVEQAEKSKEEWRAPKELLTSVLDKTDFERTEMLKWANETLRQAVLEHPEYNVLIAGETGENEES